MKRSFLFATAAFLMTGVAFEAAAIEPRISDFRARSQAGYEQSPEKTDPQVDMDHPENLAPAAGGYNELDKNNAEQQPREKLVDDKFFNMKR